MRQTMHYADGDTRLAFGICMQVGMGAPATRRADSGAVLDSLAVSALCMHCMGLHGTGTFAVTACNPCNLLLAGATPWMMLPSNDSHAQGSSRQGWQRHTHALFCWQRRHMHAPAPRSGSKGNPCKLLPQGDHPFRLSYAARHAGTIVARLKTLEAIDT